MGKKLLAILIFFSAIPAIAAGEEPTKDQTWFGYIGKTFRDVSDAVISKVREFVGGIIEAIRDIWLALFRTISDIWSYTKGWCQGFVDLFKDAWSWAKATTVSAFEYVTEIIAVIWDKFTELVTSTSEWLLDTALWAGKSCVNFLYYIMDSLLVMLVGVFEWVIDQLPAVTLPEGFEQGLQTMMDYGMILNEVFPVTHLFICIGIYLAAMLIVGIVRIIIKFIPFVG